MVRTPINLELYKAQITTLFESGMNSASICDILYEEHNVRIHSRTLSSRLRAWGIRKYALRTARQEPEFLERVKYLFSEIGANEAEMLRVLRIEGFQINARTLRRVRGKLGLVRRTDDPIQKQNQKETTLGLLLEEIQKGTIEGYGSETLYRHMRQAGQHVPRSYLSTTYLLHRDSILTIYCLIYRDLIRQLYHTLLPDAVQRRNRDLQRRRGAYIVRGPNEIWSVDGYMKLQPYGIEVYASIDAYSRYIKWIYVGVSARTQVSVVRQYLDTVKTVDKIPKKIRSDHGTETGLIGGTHIQLMQAHDPSIQAEDCYIYGTSTANQRIEAWWGQLTKSLTYKWRVCQPGLCTRFKGLTLA